MAKETDCPFEEALSIPLEEINEELLWNEVLKKENVKEG